MSTSVVPADAYTTGLLSKDLPTEPERLQLLEKTYDPGTTEALDRLPIRPDWRCLELGAGAGSIAYWLADRVPEGSVLAPDIDPRFIDAGHAEHLEVRGSDVTTDHFPAGSFDLIHARAVFMHLPQREEIVERAMRWLAPGGWLLLEDVHFLPAADSAYAAWREVHGAYLTALAGQGIDLTWARRIPAQLEAVGCDAVGVSVTPGGLGVDPVQDQLPAIRLVQSGPRLVEAGLVTDEQITAAQELVAAVPAPDISTFVYSAWGRKPIHPAG
ncbi:methyltransferase [Streptomyces spiroverticillatus]|uniref:Methyltransferase n=1 Tax=Streptomyces finlayi TaxID=67296 RepID=A0A919C8N7_9ACTN|nr:class I SAM-dependent methyltransferase [Streptomyces finlayi]GHA01056.1 methyltransferase [Streptomyces spiroverticillatus]GHC85538.1 methyltransferase [Streptomyces finlayi]